MKPRVRIAPSPTGEPHIGLAYTALFNQSILQQHGGGEFILRIEDTDETRSSRESETSIFECMEWLGFKFDESPQVGGPHGPYRQTERRDIYQKYAQQLEDNGHAFTCFCTAERLDTMRALQKKLGKTPKYDGHCLKLTAEEVKQRKSMGEPHVLRMKLPSSGECTFTDGIFGEISIPWADLDMQVLMKSGGLPTYHLAVVIDDHLMGITHLVRGEEWLPSTPKHIKLYEYFGWEMPKIYHLPVLRNPDRTKLSKRKNHTSIRWFQAQGYVPQAMINFLGQGFTRVAEGEEELMERAGMLQRYDATVASKAGAVFDLAKLDWFNGRWLREKLSETEYLNHIQQWATHEDKLTQSLLLARTRIVRLTDLPQLVSPLLSGSLQLTPQAFSHLKTTPEQTLSILQETLQIVESTQPFTHEVLWGKLKDLETKLNLKVRLITAPLFVVIHGQPQGLPLTESMALLGKALCRDRLRAALSHFSQPAPKPAEPTNHDTD